jgi:hypothetical protein
LPLATDAGHKEVGKEVTMDVNQDSVNSLPGKDCVDHVLQDQTIKSFTEEHPDCKQRVLDAAKSLFEENAGAPIEKIVEAVRRLQKPLHEGRLTVFFSYKAKDKSVANKIAELLEEWSADKLQMEHMARFGVEDVGRDWRQKIEDTIPRCDWFLLLLPNPEEERDWPLFEAGYFRRGEGLSGRLVCLHHSDNDAADVFGSKQSVPAERDAVAKFLRGLFLEANWIPGMPALNTALKNLDDKAQEIVNLIQPPPGVNTCCSPHIMVTFEDASSVKGWEQLAQGRVVNSNDACAKLFGFSVRPQLLGGWLKHVQGTAQNDACTAELAQAVQAAGEGRDVPDIRTILTLGDQCCVRPTICAVKRRKSDGALEAVHILFNEVDPPPDTSHMSPELAALATTLKFAVRFRWEILGAYAGRELKREDVLAFNKALLVLEREAVLDPRLVNDPNIGRELTLGLFDDERKAEIEKMYDCWDQLRRPDNDGELDRALCNLDGQALANIVQELLEINQRFLMHTSARFAELIAGI